MKKNDFIEIDIKNKYITDKKNTNFTIDETIYILKSKEFSKDVEDVAINCLNKYLIKNRNEILKKFLD